MKAVHICHTMVLLCTPCHYVSKLKGFIFAFICGILYHFLLLSGSKTERGLLSRSLRALKALRVATRNEGMKNLVSLVVSSLSSILNLSLLLTLVVAIFVILAVQLFSGLFYRCDIRRAEIQNQTLQAHAHGTTC
jgi:hypothetical protein